MKTVLEINNLSKHYGKLKAVDNLNLEVKEKMIFGILGPNGSGKTTTLGMLLGVTLPNQGSFSWFDNGSKDENRKRIGTLLETPNFYPYMSAKQNLEIAAKIKGTKNANESIEEVLKRVDLYERKDSKFKTFSLGMKQRLAIASALLGDPDILVLDEPTNGLDPQGIAEIRNLIIKIGEGGKTIIIASHILDEIEKVCTHCAILKKGVLIQQGTIGDIIGNQDVKLIKLGSDSINELKTYISSNNSFSVYKELEDGTIIIRTPKETNPSSLNKELTSKGIYLSHLSTFQESLENQFIDIINAS